MQSFCRLFLMSHANAMCVVDRTVNDRENVQRWVYIEFYIRYFRAPAQTHSIFNSLQ